MSRSGKGIVTSVGLLVAYGPWSVSAAQQAGRDSTADSSRTVLAPIQVSVTRRVEPALRIPFATAVLRGDAVRRGRVANGLDESLVEVPGVLVSNRYNASLDQRISIRGFGARSAFGVRGVKILIDGVPQTLPDGQGQLTNLDLVSVESIEVLRGSASSMFGNASGGVISVRTRVPNEDAVGGVARFVAGAYGLRKWNAGVSTPVGSTTLAIQGARTVADGYRQHSNSEQQQFSARFEARPDQATSILVAGHFSDAPFLENPGSLNQGELDEDPSQANSRNVDANAGKAVSQGQLGVTMTRQLGGSAELAITGFGLTRDLDNPLSFAYITLDRRAFGVRAIATRYFDAGGVRPSVQIGVDLQRQRDDRLNETPDRSAITLDQLERVTETGPFVQMTSDLGSRVTVTAGGRYDRVVFDAEDRLLADGDASGRRVMSAWSGSAGVVVRVTPAFQPYANVGTSFETPTTTELVNRPTGAGGFNPDLQPQRATTVEVGLRGAVSDVFRFSAAVFNADVRDALIPFEVPGDPGGRRYFRNAGSSRHRGAELEVRVRPAPWLSIVSAYTAANYEFVDFETEGGTFDGNTIPGVPDHLWYASLRASLPKGLWVAADNTYSSDVFVDDANAAMIPGWNATGLRGGWDGSVRGWRVAPFAGVLNLFDERYVSSAVVNANFGRYFEPAPPRNVYVGLEIAPGR